jgi:hypothetical protein
VDDINIQLKNWEEPIKDPEKGIASLQGLALLKHASIEFTKIIQILNQIEPKKFMDVLYISLVRSYNYMRKALDFNPLDNKRIFFIDCVSGYAFPDEDMIDDCFYHRPPSNINDMRKIMRFGLEKSDPDIVVIDSLSQYISYSKSNINDMIYLIESFRNLTKQKLSLQKITIILLYDTKLGQFQDISSISNYIDISLDV